MARRRDKSRLFVSASCALALAITSLAFHLHLQNRSVREIYVPVTKGNHPVVKIAYFDRGLRFYSGAEYDAVLAKVLPDWAAILLRSFVRLDRKQNLRLWPVVASGVVRSPPSLTAL